LIQSDKTKGYLSLQVVYDLREITYDPKEVQKWLDIRRRGIDYMKSLLNEGKMNRSDIPLIKNIIRSAKEQEDKKTTAQEITKELEGIISLIENNQ
jgi:hypothetical protein